MAAYPSTLPSPTIDSYSITPFDPTIRTDMANGLAKVRRVTRRRVDTISVRWTFTRVQFAAFRNWWHDSTGADGGAAWFNIKLYSGVPSSGAAGGDCEQQNKARFAGPWAASPNTAYYFNVTADLEVVDA